MVEERTDDWGHTYFRQQLKVRDLADGKIHEITSAHLRNSSGPHEPPTELGMSGAEAKAKLRGKGAPSWAVISMDEFDHCADDEDSDSVRFGHPSEVAFVRKLEAAGLFWQREPDLFDMSPASSFQPDFFLPGLGMYVEVTTNPSSNAKAAKMRGMREQYAGVDVISLSLDPLMRSLDMPAEGLAAALKRELVVQQRYYDHQLYCKKRLERAKRSRMWRLHARITKARFAARASRVRPLHCEI